MGFASDWLVGARRERGEGDRRRSRLFRGAVDAPSNIGRLAAKKRELRAKRKRRVVPLPNTKKRVYTFRRGGQVDRQK